MSVALLDVNVLIALLDRRHVHHEAAHGWFAMAQADGWATCPLTQNAVLRILGQPRYPNSPGPPAVVAPLMAELIRHPQHQFWPDSLSLVDQSGVNTSRLLEASHLTDTYLLALAAARGGRLASFDRRLSCAAVVGGRETLWLIDGRGTGVIGNTNASPSLFIWPACHDIVRQARLGWPQEMQ